jgi:pimeloyl-ACP methyl ester carboxylesterase
VTSLFDAAVPFDAHRAGAAVPGATSRNSRPLRRAPGPVERGVTSSIIVRDGGDERKGEMAELYPEIESYEHGMLDVGEGQRVYWEVCGNPNGKPAVVLHGGPGSGCTPGLRRYFDPAAYRIVLFDQRGAGRSVPDAGDPTIDLSTNTTHHLISDIELLREHLGIDRWLVFGGSWGATLALTYAERHPQRVAEIVLASVTMTRPAEIQWLYHGVGRFLPEEWTLSERRSGRGARRRPGRRLLPAAQSGGPDGPREGRTRLVRLGRRSRLTGTGLSAQRSLRRPAVPDGLR